jgi:hypothetical protein
VQHKRIAERKKEMAKDKSKGVVIDPKDNPPLNSNSVSI